MITFHPRVALTSLVMSLSVGIVACEGKKADPPRAEPVATVAPTPPKPALISVAAATFGRACGAKPGNHTEPVSKACDGKEKCSFKVTIEQGDPFPGCPKDFDVEYKCGELAPRKVSHPAAEGENYSVELTCGG